MIKKIYKIPLIFALLLGIILIPNQAKATDYDTVSFHSELLTQTDDGRFYEFNLINTSTNQEQTFKLYNEKVTLKLERGEYKLIEIKTPDGVVKQEKPIIFDSETFDNNVLEIKGEEVNKDLMIIKKDRSDDKLLSGAHFELYTKKDGEYKKINTDSDIVTDQKGKALIKNVGNGSYKLIEIKAPIGYKLSTEDILFEVDNKDSDPVIVIVYNDKEEPQKEEETKDEKKDESKKEEKKDESKKEEKKSGKISHPNTSDAINYKLYAGIGLAGFSVFALVLYFESKKKKGEEEIE